MGRLFLGLVLAGSLLVGTGPQQTAAGQPVVDTAAKAESNRDACGPKTRKPNGRPWRCTFVDHFKVPKLSRFWVQHPEKVPLSPGAACKKRKNVKVWNGQLQLSVNRTGKVFGCQFHVGAVTTYHTFSQKYGRFQARIRVRGTQQRGLQEAFWLWPDDRVKSKDRWPASGEIDIAETYSQHPDLAVPFLHYGSGGVQKGVNTAQDCEAKRGKWHVYTLIWGPEKIEIKVDGKRCLLNTSGDRAFKKKYIVCFTAMNGIGGNRVTSKTPLPSTMRVDWVKVWR